MESLVDADGMGGSAVWIRAEKIGPADTAKVGLAMCAEGDSVYSYHGCAIYISNRLKLKDVTAFTKRAPGMQT